MKTCNICNKSLDISNFYKAKKPYYQSACITCYNELRNIKSRMKTYLKPDKFCSFDALSEDKKEELLLLICFKYTWKDISKITNINYNTLYYWKKKQLIPKYSEYFNMQKISMTNI